MARSSGEGVAAKITVLRVVTKCSSHLTFRRNISHPSSGLKSYPRKKPAIRRRQAAFWAGGKKSDAMNCCNQKL
jgi:hypothetical protein